jgi:hypothetical protein
MPLSDDDIFKIASAWPRLQSIDLSYSYKAGRTSIMSLRYLVTLCPQLTSLSISLKLKKEVHVLAPTPTSPHPLEELSLGFTTADDALVTIHQLKPLFPNLTDVTTYGTAGTNLLTGLLHSDST